MRGGGSSLLRACHVRRRTWGDFLTATPVPFDLAAVFLIGLR